MQGADTPGVAIGTFDRQKIEAAADGIFKDAARRTADESTYRGTRSTPRATGFNVLTSKVALFGNDIGVRRAIDRVEEGRAKAASEVHAGAATPNAPPSSRATLTCPLPAAARDEFSFIEGLETPGARRKLRGSGVNLAGTLSYGDDQSA
jgi:hypothetical protein